MNTPKIKLCKIYTSGILVASCLIGGLSSTSSLAELSPELQPLQIPVEATVGKTYTGAQDETKENLYFFTPSKSGAYLLDLDEKTGYGYLQVIEHDGFGLHTTQNYHEEDREDDLYCYLEKDKQYEIRVSCIDLSAPYEFKISNSDFGATAYYDIISDPGEDVTLKVNAASKNKISYSWKDSDNNVIGTDSSYSFKADKTGGYTCDFDLGDGHETTFYFWDNVYSGFALTNVKFNGELTYTNTSYLKPGTPFELEACVEMGSYTGDVHYQWSTGDGEIIEGATGPKLNVADGVTRGTYFFCEAWDDYNDENSVWSACYFVGIENGFSVPDQGINEIYLNGEKTANITVNFTATDSSDMTFNWRVYKAGDLEGQSFTTTTPTLTLENVDSYREVTLDFTDKFGNVGYATYCVHTGAAPTLDVSDFVSRYYTNILKREADRDGLAYWGDMLTNSQATGADVARSFLSSPEFQSINMNDDAFVETLYSTFFGRIADSDGKAYWLSQLASGALTRESAIESFIGTQEWIDICTDYGIAAGSPVTTTTADTSADTSADAVNAFVERMYTTALGRDSEPEGKAYWAGELASHRTTGENVGLFFFLSEELKSQNLSGDEFVTRLYKTFMDREPDAEGFTYWRDSLNAGFISAEDIVRSFARSTEFTDRCAAAGIVSFS